MQIEESNLPLEDRKEDKNTKTSTLRLIVINETPPKGMKIFCESNGSNSNKESILHTNHENLNSDLQFVPMQPSLMGWFEIKKRKGKKVRSIYFF
jgi:hypothetical protein